MVDLKLRVQTVEGVRSESSKEVEVAIAGDVLFAFNESALTAEALALLGRLADEMRNAASGEVRIVGHTDSIASPEFNLELSRARAQAVEGELRRLLGDAGFTFLSEGRGESEPVAPNTTEDGTDNPEGRALNRRVEVTYQKRDT